MEQINTDKNKYSSDYHDIICSRKYIDANNEINDEIDNMISHLNRNDDYMTLRVPTSKVVNSFLNLALMRKLPSNITIK
jgi:disulfide oxidoreductase YuzD